CSGGPCDVEFVLMSQGKMYVATLHDSGGRAMARFTPTIGGGTTKCFVVSSAGKPGQGKGYDPAGGQPLKGDKATKTPAPGAAPHSRACDQAIQDYENDVDVINELGGVNAIKNTPGGGQLLDDLGKAYFNVNTSCPTGTAGGLAGPKK